MRYSASSTSTPRPVAVPAWKSTAPPRWLMALAASLILVAAVALWNLMSLRNRPAQVAVNPPTTETPAALPQTGTGTPNTLRLFALTLSPVAVRSASDSPAVVVPPGTGRVAIRFERDADGRALTPTRASVRIVGGTEVWGGPVASAANPPAGVMAQVEVPAASLPAGDYLVTLFGTDSAGVEHEWSQYFMRLRAR